VEWQGPQAARYRIDPLRLRQVLLNLISNAIKFTASGQVTVLGREVACEGALSTLEFSVSDTGIGISPDQQLQLFQPFSQVDSSLTRRYEGSGLGLSIARRLVDLFGGQIGVDSEPGQGSRFWFRLQAERLPEAEHDKPEPLAAAQRTPALTEAPEPQRPLSGNVLVVEDHPMNRMLIQTMLAKLGLTARFAEHGQEAVSLLASGAPIDLVLMDLQMPVMDGFAATTEIRRWEAAQSVARRLPIVALTANAYDDTRHECLRVGMDDFLAKPVVLRDLHRVLTRWLPDPG
jgi:CheY-like chemotaxis protein